MLQPEENIKLIAYTLMHEQKINVETVKLIFSNLEDLHIEANDNSGKGFRRFIQRIQYKSLPTTSTTIEGLTKEIWEGGEQDEKYNYSIKITRTRK